MKIVKLFISILIFGLLLAGCGIRVYKEYDAQETMQPGDITTTLVTRIITVGKEDETVHPPEQITPLSGVIPSFYVELSDYRWTAPIYAFLDINGTVQYRAYVKITTYISDNLCRFDKGFVNIHFDNCANNSIAPIYYFDENPKFLKDKNCVLTEYEGEDYYPRNDDGTPKAGAIPVVRSYDSNTQIVSEYYVLENGYKVKVNSFTSLIEKTERSTIKPTYTPSPTMTPKPSPVETHEPIETESPTPVPSETPIASEEPEQTVSPAPTATPEPTEEPTIEPTEDHTEEPASEITP